MPEVIDYDKLAAGQAAADEIACPGITVRRQARHTAEETAREAHRLVEEKYGRLLDKGQPTHELFMLAAVLGRSAILADDIEERLALQRGGDELARLHNQRLRAKHEARERESDRAMMPFVFAQQQDSPPDDVMASVVAPPAANGPPVQHLDRPIRLGMLDGHEVTVGVGRLG